jgi:hypothetical protein
MNEQNDTPVLKSCQHLRSVWNIAVEFTKKELPSVDEAAPKRFDSLPLRSLVWNALTQRDDGFSILATFLETRIR